MPLGESMISSLKSNKSIKLDKSSRFKKTLGGYGKNRKVTFDFPEANPQLLEHIRLKAKKEHQRNQLIFALSFVFLFIIAAVSMFYFNII